MISFRKGTLRKLCSGGDASIVQRLILNQDGYWLDENSERIDEPIEKWVYVFNGSDSYVDTNQVAVSLEGRFKVDAQVNSSGCLISNRTSSNNYFEVNAGSIGQPLVTVDLKESPTHYTLSSNFINDGAWHNIEVIYTGTTLTILIDGLPDSTLNNITPLSSNNNNVLIGTNNNNGHVLNGMLSNFKWMNLNQDILLQYNMEEQAGDIAYDASGKRIHGTHYGGLTHTTVVEPLYNHVNKEGYSDETYFDGDSYFVSTDDFDFSKHWSIELNIQRINDTLVHVVSSDSNAEYEPIAITPEGFVRIHLRDKIHTTKRLLHFNKEEVLKVVYGNGQVEVYVNNVLEEVFSTKVYLFDIAKPKAAYSLFKLDSNYTGPVINVRRAFDNTTLDIGYVGDDLDVATLESFCQPNTIAYQSDFTSGNEDLSEFNGIGTDGETVAGVNDCYKFESTNGLTTHQTFSILPEDGAQYSMTFDYYIPSTNAKIDGITVLPKLGGGSGIFGGVDQWITATIILEVPDGQLPRLRFFASEGTTYVNIDADGDVFYLKNIQITQLTTNGYVTTWYDQSGNGYDATQTVSSLQPQIVNNGSVILENGKPIIQNVVDSSFDINQALDIAQPVTQFAVIKNENTRAILNTYNSFYYVFAAEDNSSSTVVFNQNVDNSFLNSNSKTFINRNDAWDSTSNQSLVTFYWNNPAYNQLKNIGWTGTSWAMPSLQTFIVYNSDQSANRVAIESNLNEYYNIYGSSTTPLLIGSNAALDTGYRGYLKDVSIYNDGVLFYESNLNKTINGLGSAVTGTNVHFKKLPRVFDCIAVQDYPWAWITQQHYIIYKGNYFQPSFDGTVLVGDAADYDAITSIDLSNTGIDTTINATMINKFPFLTDLILSNTNVYLDLSGITAPIFELRINNTGANVVDVSSLISMQILQANDNYIYQLDISNNDIDQLYLNNNALSTIDLANNTLTVIEASNNQLTQVITPNAPYTTNDLILYDNQLTDVDLTAFPLANVIQIYNNLINAIDSSDLIIDLDNNAIANSISNGYLEGEINGAGYLSPLSLTSYYNLTNPNNTTSGNWTIVGYVYQLFPGTTYNVEDFPYTWINNSYYTVWTGNTFEVTTTINMPHSLLYDAVTLINLSNNSLTTDITDTFLSHYSNLMQLFLQNNSITVLDLTNAVTLFLLNASNNQIASVNLLNLSALTVLDLSRNPISSLDLSGNPLLAYLDISDTNLTSLDTSSNPSISTLDTTGNSIDYIENSNILYNLYTYNLANAGTFDTSIFGGGFVTPHAVYYSNQLINAGWTLTGFDLELFTNIIYNVEDFPYVWIDDNYYLTYTANTFEVTATTPMPDNFAYESVSSINVSNQQPVALTTDFTETLLEKYSQLVTLNVALNQITVFEPYLCPLLETIDCSENFISTLDIGALAALKDLIAYKNNLSSINIANNPNLERLFIHQNSLSVLDISTAPALLQLTCYDNAIVDINVSNNTLLNLINSSNNQLSNLVNSQMLIDVDTLNINTTGTINSTIFTATNEQLTIAGVEAFRNLTNVKSWIIVGLTDQLLTGQDYNVEEFPLVWINGLYYNTYTANTFQVSTQTAMPISSDYVGITTIDLNSLSLTTDFTDELLSKYPDLDRLYLYTNDITVLDLQSCINLTSLLVNDNANLSAIDLTNCVLLNSIDVTNCNLTDLNVTYNPQVLSLLCAGNALNAATNSQLLIDLDIHGLSNGTFITDITPTTEYISPLAVDAFNNLKTVKGWNIAGIDGILYTGTYDVEDFPLVWLDTTNNYYQTYTGNTFTTTADVPMPGQSDYDLITTIQVLSGGLTTDFTNTLLSKYKNLISLNLGSNSIGIVELQDNLALTNLTLSNNNLLTIDLSNNVSLTTINLNDNALMTSIILNGVYSQLTSFRASTNLITSINVLNMPALTFLDLQNTDITSLDITNNTLLQTLYLTSCLLDTNANRDIINNLLAHGLIGGTFNTTNVTNDPLLLDDYQNYLDLKNTNGWTVNFINQFDPTLLNSGQTYNVEDFPYVWINDNYYTTYTGNTFVVGTSTMPDKADYASVTTIDLTGAGVSTDFTDTLLSKYTSLTTLILNNNAYSVLETQSLTNLVTLELRAASNLYNIDISNNINLEYLTTHNHQISVLDVTYNAKLKRIWCYYSNLTTIITGGTVYPDLIDIRVHGSMLTTLDLSPYPELSFLRCHLNQLTALDFSNNPKLSNIDCSDNAFDVAAVEQIISDLLAYNTVTGSKTLNINIDTGGILTPAGYNDLVALVNDGWLVVGL